MHICNEIVVMIISVYASVLSVTHGNMLRVRQTGSNHNNTMRTASIHNSALLGDKDTLADTDRDIGTTHLFTSIDNHIHEVGWTSIGAAFNAHARYRLTRRYDPDNTNNNSDNESAQSALENPNSIMDTPNNINNKNNDKKKNKKENKKENKSDRSNTPSEQEQAILVEWCSASSAWSEFSNCPYAFEVPDILGSWGVARGQVINSWIFAGFSSDNQVASMSFRHRYNHGYDDCVACEQERNRDIQVEFEDGDSEIITLANTADTQYFTFSKTHSTDGVFMLVLSAYNAEWSNGAADITFFPPDRVPTHAPSFQPTTSPRPTIEGELPPTKAPSTSSVPPPPPTVDVSAIEIDIISCDASSQWDNEATCEYAYEDNDSLGSWGVARGEVIGSWIELFFEPSTPHAVYAMSYRHRYNHGTDDCSQCENERNKDIHIEFSSGASEYVTLADVAETQYFNFATDDAADAHLATWARITVITAYDTSWSNGASDIGFYTAPFTAEPSGTPSEAPSFAPTYPSPTNTPTTAAPTAPPTSAAPSLTPTFVPSALPTTAMPSTTPTIKPTALPSTAPSAAPTMVPTSAAPSTTPTESPTAVPSIIPTIAPSVWPTAAPSAVPTTSTPTVNPTTSPTTAPTTHPTSAAPTTSTPTVNPTTSPTTAPTMHPTSAAPTTSTPTTEPTTAIPSTAPTSAYPTTSPTLRPSTAPSLPPYVQPSTSSPTDSGGEGANNGGNNGGESEESSDAEEGGTAVAGNDDKDDSSNGKSTGLEAGAIAGIVVVAICLSCLGFTVGCCILNNNKKSDRRTGLSNSMHSVDDNNNNNGVNIEDDERSGSNGSQGSAMGLHSRVMSGWYAGTGDTGDTGDTTTTANAGSDSVVAFTTAGVPPIAECGVIATLRPHSGRRGSSRSSSSSTLFGSPRIVADAIPATTVTTTTNASAAAVIPSVTARPFQLHSDTPVEDEGYYSCSSTPRTEHGGVSGVGYANSGPVAAQLAPISSVYRLATVEMVVEDDNYIGDEEEEEEVEEAEEHERRLFHNSESAAATAATTDTASHSMYHYRNNNNNHNSNSSSPSRPVTAASVAAAAAQRLRNTGNTLVGSIFGERGSSFGVRSSDYSAHDSPHRPSPSRTASAGGSAAAAVDTSLAESFGADDAAAAASGSPSSRAVAASLTVHRFGRGNFTTNNSRGNLESWEDSTTIGAPRGADDNRNAQPRSSSSSSRGRAHVRGSNIEDYAIFAGQESGPRVGRRAGSALGDHNSNTNEANQNFTRPRSSATNTNTSRNNYYNEPRRSNSAAAAAVVSSDSENENNNINYSSASYRGSRHSRSRNR